MAFRRTVNKLLQGEQTSLYHMKGEACEDQKSFPCCPCSVTGIRCIHSQSNQNALSSKPLPEGILHNYYINSMPFKCDTIVGLSLYSGLPESLVTVTGSPW